MASTNEEIAKEETMIRKANDVWVLTIRKGLNKIKSVVDARNQVLDIRVVRENGKPYLKIDLEPKQHEEKH